MMSSTVHEDLRASLIAFCQAQIEAFNLASVTVGATFVDFDSHATLTTLPDNDVIGIKGFSWLGVDSLAEVDVLFGVSTVNDTNLFRHHNMMGLLADKLQEECQIEVVSASADPKEVIGFMVATSGTQVLPIPGTTTRPVQFITVTFKTDIPVKRA